MGSTKQEREFMMHIEAHRGIMHKVCRMYCERETDRQDLEQEILIQLWKSYPSFRGDAQFSTWMYRVALNVAIQDLRKVKRRKLLILESNDYTDRPEVKAEHYSDDQLGRLYQAIRHLDRVDKAIVLLYLEGQNTEDIGHIVGITGNYARVKLTRIRKKLSDHIENTSDGTS
jgi:RNA polymerase sigma factor (sigma-70 family)